jgi:hypothetical protein
MLRDVRSPFLAPRLVGVRYTVSGGTSVSPGVTGTEFTSSGISAGAFTLALRRAFSRRGIFVGNASSIDVGLGGFIGGTANTFPGATGHKIISNNAGGTPTNGTVHGMYLGFDSGQQGRFKRSSNVIRCALDMGIIRALRVNTTNPGTVSINARNFSLVRNGTGDVTITLKNVQGGNALPIVVATAVSATTAIVNIDTVTNQSF